MANYDEVATRWLDIALGKSTKRQLRNERMPAVGDSIYSYGTHFELARVLRDRKGRPTSILVNGDRFSNTTTTHQNVVRGVVNRSGLRTVIIPFTALDSAGISRDTVEIVDVHGDRTEIFHHQSDTEPEGSVWGSYNVTEYLPISEERLQAKVDKKNAAAVTEWEQARGWAEADPSSYWATWLQEHPTPPLPLYTVDDLPYYEKSESVVTGVKHYLRRGKATWSPTIAIEDLPDGSKRYTWETSRHWLGESLVKAKVRWTGFTRCKPCKGSGENPNRAADANRWDAGFRCSTCHGRGRRSWSRTRPAYFLSGFDHEESTPLYFFCELAKGAKPTTVAEGYDTLKPEAVRLAEQIDRPVIRQGDVYAISLPSVDKRSLRRQGARFEKRGTLLNTSHEATEVAYLPDGTTLARGVLHHNPDMRAPDHKRRRLTQGWNVVIKNTVPLAA